VLAGRLERSLGEMANAERHLEHAVETAPERPEAFVERAWLRHAQQRTTEGIADAERALRLLESCRVPGLEPVRGGGAGLLYAAASRSADSRRMFARLSESSPQEAQAFVWRGRASLVSGRPEEALADARAALALEPHSGSALELSRAAESAARRC